MALQSTLQPLAVALANALTQLSSGQELDTAQLLTHLTQAVAGKAAAIPADGGQRQERSVPKQVTPVLIHLGFCKPLVDLQIWRVPKIQESASPLVDVSIFVLRRNSQFS